MISQEEFVDKKYKQLQDSSGKVIVEITMEDWNPSAEFLKNFYKETYRSLVNLYKQLEESQEYDVTEEVFFARSKLTGKNIAWCVGASINVKECCSTHNIGWELKSLLEEHTKNPQPFDLKLLIKGYKDQGYENHEPEKIPYSIEALV